MLQFTVPQRDVTDKRDAAHQPRFVPASKSANCHYPIQYKDSIGLCCRSGYPPDGMAHRHDAMVTTCGPVDFSNQSAFLMKGNGRTPLRGSIFVTELAPMIWQF
ncbi:MULTISPECIES: hypothetical protein [unclassified Pseudomonas]|uniref:hypothetical protein n=1 Tax=Pseudomonas TaxID=286 RepID=UPI0012ECE8DC|nr:MULTISPECIES: hypothetical protein [unclassified Pseudomonas]